MGRLQEPPDGPWDLKTIVVMVMKIPMGVDNDDDDHGDDVDDDDDVAQMNSLTSA